MRRFFEPASAPAWLKAVLASIRAALGDVWDVPVRPFQAASADLPGAADWTGGWVWDSTLAAPAWSDGSAWKTASAAGHAHSGADIQLGATDRLLGRDSAGAGAAEELTVGGGIEFTGSGGIRRSALTGDVTASAGSGSTAIANDAVANAKLANMAASTIKARKTAGTGDPEDCTLSEVLDLIGSAAHGDILCRGASGWTRLGAGTSGQFLKTLGTGADPAWSTVGLGAWSLVDSRNCASAPAANFDFTNLSAYGELLLVLDAVTGSAGTANRTVRVSTDNGSTFYSTSGDYVELSAAGTVTNRGSCSFLSGATATAATTVTQFRNTKGAAKFIVSSSAGNFLFRASASDINAVRVTSNSADTLNGGTIYLFGR